MKCEIEANVSCCDSCQRKVRRNLKRIRGVESVELYPEVNRVVVTGKFKPSALLDAVNEVKASARILTVEASRPANNFGVVNDEDGGGRDHDTTKNKKKKAASIHQKATVDYYPETPSGGTAGIASEATTYGLNLTAYGFGGVISYRKDVTYK